MISLVVGLGNIGRKYIGTRHNVGFESLDRLARVLGVEDRNRSDLYSWSAATIDDRRVMLVWPSTYMNRSGRAVAALLERHRLEPAQCLVVVDDFNLPLGTLRFRERGSDGGHNGLISIVEELGTREFSRLRLGIGPKDGEGRALPLDKDRVIDFVLGRFDECELTAAQTMIDTAAEAVEFALKHCVVDAMSRYNGMAG